jgi:tRNA(fMet)-specific endonuclease VapC
MYLLDTNILSELIKKRPNSDFIARLRKENSQSLCTSSICVFELRLGSALRDDFPIFWKRIKEELLSEISILHFGEECALAAGDILAQLRKTGQLVGIEDVFIASTSLANRCTLVTANIKHYSRIQGLKIENWIK